jgi:hypothetical protein
MKRVLWVIALLMLLLASGQELTAGHRGGRGLRASAPRSLPAPGVRAPLPPSLGAPGEAPALSL